MYVCMYVCMYAINRAPTMLKHWMMHICVSDYEFVRAAVFMYICMSVCMYVCYQSCVNDIETLDDAYMC